MLDQDNNFYLISFIILDIIRDKTHVNHFWEVIWVNGFKIMYALKHMFKTYYYVAK